MREARLVHLYKEPWHLVVQAYQKRFEKLPHPKIPALVEAVFENFHWDPKEQELSWVVLGRIDVPIPNWVKKLTGCSHCVFRTVNILNYAKRTLSIRITNDDFRHIAVVEENNCFRVHPENDQWTEYEQVSRLTIRSLLGMQSQVEGIVMRSYSEVGLCAYTFWAGADLVPQNYEAGREVDNEFIQNLLRMEHLPRRGYLEGIAAQRAVADTPIPFTHFEHSVTSSPLKHVNKTESTSEAVKLEADHSCAEVDLQISRTAGQTLI